MKKTARITIAIAIALLLSTAFTVQVQAWDVEPGLYAGISNPASVYWYDGASWTLIGTFPDDFAVLCLVQFGGELYAGTKSSLEFGGVGRVYRYDGGTTWTLVGDNLASHVAFLVVFDGNLYAGAHGPGRIYRYDGGTTWTLTIEGFGEDPRSGFVYGDMLLFAAYMHHRFYHTTDGVTYTEDDYPFGGCEGVYDYEVYDGYVYASAGLGPDLYRSSDGTTWSVAIPIGWPTAPDLIGYDESWHNWELEAFNGYLYMSVDNGTLARWDGSSHSNVWVTPDEQSIISMDVSFFQSEMYLGVGGEAVRGDAESGTGRVYCYDGTTFQLISGDMGTGVQVLYSPPIVPSHVIPEIPLGTVVASVAMIVALVAYVAVPKWRRKRQHIPL